MILVLGSERLLEKYLENGIGINRDKNLEEFLRNMLQKKFILPKWTIIRHMVSIGTSEEARIMGGKIPYLTGHIHHHKKALGGNMKVNPLIIRTSRKSRKEFGSERKGTQSCTLSETMQSFSGLTCKA